MADLIEKLSEEIDTLLLQNPVKIKDVATNLNIAYTTESTRKTEQWTMI